MLGAYGFLGAVFNDFERHKLSDILFIFCYYYVLLISESVQ